jgi:hypothetical protein
LKEDVILCNSRLSLLAAASLGCAAACGSAAAGDQTGIATSDFSSFYGPGGPGNGPVSVTYDPTTNQTLVEFTRITVTLYSTP